MDRANVGTRRVARAARTEAHGRHAADRAAIFLSEEVEQWIKLLDDDDDRRVSVLDFFSERRY